MYKVLIVDDEKLIKRSLSALLKKHSTGFQLVGEAKDGEEALELVQMHHPHLIITDIRMPKLNGLDFIQKARSLNQQIKFMILSGYDDFTYAQQALRYGVNDFLLKPIKPELLLTALETVRNEIELESPSRAERQEQLSFITSTAEDISHLIWMLEEQELVGKLKKTHAYLLQKHTTQLTMKGFYEDLVTYVSSTLEKRVKEMKNVIIPEITFPYGSDELHNRFLTYCQEWMILLKQVRNIGHKTTILNGVDYINTHFADHALTLQKVATIVGMSPSYFSMEFKKEMGESYKCYVTKLRIEKAKTLLKNPLSKSYDIAESVGYGDYPHFTKTFKKSTGYTPTQFRKRFGID